MEEKASDILCKKIADQSNGVCLIGFSRGKDMYIKALI